MAITEVRLTEEDFDLSDRKRTYNATYRVKSDADPAAVLILAGAQLAAAPATVPALFATYSLKGATDANAFCQSLSCKREGSADSLRFVVSASWSPIEGDPSDDFDTESNPLTRPVRYSGAWEEVQLPIEEGWNEEALTGIDRSAETLGPIVNAAGIVPATPFMRTIRLPSLIAKKNYSTLNEIWTIGGTFNDALNSAAFKGRAAGEALYRGIEASEMQYAGGVNYYEGTHRITFYGGGWKQALVNRGFASLEEDDEGEPVLQPIKIKNAIGKEVAPSEPQNLELDGTRTPDGQVGTVINYRTSPKVDFSTLGI